MGGGRIIEPVARGTILQEALPWRTPQIRRSGAITVVGTGSFEAAHWLQTSRGCKRVCVLDFASDSNPGGGWRGKQTGTQEEALCRASSLGRALEKLNYPISAFGMAHVPEVVVFGAADGQVLPVPFKVGVVAAALRDVGGDGQPDAKQRAHLQRKVDGVLSTMASIGYDGVVLGPWGCGAFGNPPALVAEAFASALGCEHCTTAFAEICFACPRQPSAQAFWDKLQSLGAQRIESAAGSTEVGEEKLAGPVAVRRWLSEAYGPGASAHSEEELAEWYEQGVLGKAAARQRDWKRAQDHFERCVELRPEWSKGHECLARVRAKAQQEDGTDAVVVHEVMPTVERVLEAELERVSEAKAEAVSEIKAEAEAPSTSEDRLHENTCMPSAASRRRSKGVRLLVHERELIERGELHEVTHAGSSARWLQGSSTALSEDNAE